MSGLEIGNDESAFRTALDVLARSRSEVDEHDVRVGDDRAGRILDRADYLAGHANLCGGRDGKHEEDEKRRYESGASRRQHAGLLEEPNSGHTSTSRDQNPASNRRQIRCFYRRISDACDVMRDDRIQNFGSNSLDWIPGGRAAINFK